MNRYLASAVQKCCYIKTPIINREKPTFLFDIYVNARVKLKNELLSDDDLIERLPILKSLVVVGTAGAGKSMVMRYTFIYLCERGFGRIPPAYWSVRVVDDLARDVRGRTVGVLFLVAILINDASEQAADFALHDTGKVEHPSGRRSILSDQLGFGQMAVGERFVFHGEMNTLPTTKRPIRDLVTDLRGRWAVFPQAKLQLKAAPSTDPSMQAHQVMTSGAVTLPKVIARKAGVKSISHHRGHPRRVRS